MYRKFKYVQDWIILGLFLIPPLTIGYWAGQNEIIRKPWVKTVDIVEYEDEICIYEHGSFPHLADESSKFLIQRYFKIFMALK